MRGSSSNVCWVAFFILFDEIEFLDADDDECSPQCMLLRCLFVVDKDEVLKDSALVPTLLPNFLRFLKADKTHSSDY